MKPNKYQNQAARDTVSFLMSRLSKANQDASRSKAQKW